jgi:hypothetical protein
MRPPVNDLDLAPNHPTGGHQAASNVRHAPRVCRIALSPPIGKKGRLHSQFDAAPQSVVQPPDCREVHSIRQASLNPGFCRLGRAGAVGEFSLAPPDGQTRFPDRRSNDIREMAAGWARS